jgi:hypothetical protein
VNSCEHIPFALLSDSGLRLAEQLHFPTFTADGMTLYKRLTFVAEAGKIARVFYPVFPPNRNAAEVLTWLSEHALATRFPWRLNTNICSIDGRLRKRRDRASWRCFE